MYIFCILKNGFVVIFISLVFIFPVPGKAWAADIGLIDAVALNQSLSSWTLLDARPVKQWQQRHIPGARSFSWEEYTRTDEKGIPYRILPPEQLAEALGKMGIDETTQVVVYGDADTSWGGEGWVCWVLVWIGHKCQIRLLDGGIQAWNANGFPVKAGDESFIGEPSVYHYTVRSSVNISAEDIRNNPSTFQIVDTRSTLEWIKGRIPGAIHIPWEKFYTGDNRQPIDSTATRNLLQQNDINPDRPVVYYCTGGIRSGYAWMVYCLAGLPEAVNFEGGMAEWEKTTP
jgi:thiosulfate/3-mercaptopyruvate sulfurtransferase